MRIPVTILTGFLGSGKTSLLRSALADPRMDETAVIINEIGDVGLDHLLVGKLDDDAVLLKSGCLCCSLKTDFIETLTLMYHRRESGKFPPFKRVIVETTGLADPVPLLRVLMSSEPVNHWFSIKGVISTVDLMINLNVKDDREERIRQIALADTLVLTKNDLVAKGRQFKFRQALSKLNPRARVILNSDTDRLFEVLLNEERYPVVSNLFHNNALQTFLPLNEKTVHTQVTTYSLFIDPPLAWSGIIQFFRAVVRMYGTQILRIKGLLNILESEKPVVVHGVETYFFPEAYLDEWPDNDRRSRLVFIVEGLEEERILECLNKYV